MKKQNREHIDSPKPGDVIDGGGVGVPIFDRLRGDLCQALPWLDRARRHLIVDGVRGKAARRHATTIAQMVRRLARQAGRHGAYLCLFSPATVSNMGSDYSGSLRRIRALVWVVQDNRVLGQVLLESSGDYALPPHLVLRYPWRRADVTWRKMLGYP